MSTFDQCIAQYGDEANIDVLVAIANKYLYSKQLAVYFCIDTYLANKKIQKIHFKARLSRIEMVRNGYQHTIWMRINTKSGANWSHS